MSAIYRSTNRRNPHASMMRMRFLHAPCLIVLRPPYRKCLGSGGSTILSPQFRLTSDYTEALWWLVHCGCDT